MNDAHQQPGGIPGVTGKNGLRTCKASALDRSEGPEIVIAAGLAQSGWEGVTPVLEGLGCELVDAAFERWHESVLEPVRLIGDLSSASLGRDLMPADPDEASAEPRPPVVLADSRNLWLLDFWATQFPQARFLLFYTGAEAALAAALDEGVDPRPFIDKWLAGNELLLRFQRHHRGRAILLDAEASSLRPEQLREAFKRIGLALPGGRLEGRALEAAPLLERLVARSLLQGHGAVKVRQGELEAAAVPLGPPAETLALSAEALVAHYAERQSQARAMRAEFDQMRERLANAEELAEEAKAALAHNENRMEQLRDDAEAREGALANEIEQLRELGQARERELANETRDLREEAAARERALVQEIEQLRQEYSDENELLLLQLHQVQEELEGVFLAKQELDNKLARREQGLVESQRQIHAAQERQASLQHESEGYKKERDELRSRLEASRRELEQVRKAHADTRAASQETRDENELLLLQLHQVQEELEQYYLKYQEVVARLPPEQPEDPVPAVSDQETETDQAQAAEEKGGFWRLRRKQDRSRPSKSEQRRLQRSIELIRQSGLFDEAWYRLEYEDVANAGVDPVRHYIRFGAAEGRNPSPRFDTQFYLETYPDVAASQLNPLVHFIRFGREEGRLPRLGGVRP